jgi:hypothetical protein
MQNSVSFLSFINNEKMVLKHKLENMKLDKNPILNGIKILEELIDEIKTSGEKVILEKYSEKEICFIKINKQPQKTRKKIVHLSK